MKNTIYLTLITLLILDLTSCNNEISNDSKKEEGQTQTEIIITKAQFKNGKMTLGNITVQPFPEIIKTTGTIDVPPQNKAVITSYFAGNVQKSNLLIGDKVRKGQALVTIANPEFIDIQQAYLEASKQLQFLKTEYERQKTLFDEKISSKKNYLTAKAAYDREKAMYNGLRKKLQMLHINTSQVEQGNIYTTITLYSPISGSVTEVNVSKGTYVSPQDVVMEIVDADHIHIELTAFEKDVLKIKKEQQITFKIPEASDSIYKAAVHLVGTAIEEDTRTIKVHGHLDDDKKHTFAIGMFVEAEIEIGKKEVFALPEEAIVEKGDEYVVLALKSQDNHQYSFETVTVQTGKHSLGFVEIIANTIKPKDKLLTKGAYSLVRSDAAGGHEH